MSDCQHGMCLEVRRCSVCDEERIAELEKIRDAAQALIDTNGEWSPELDALEQAVEGDK